jgi:hypothetical protein
VDAGAIKTGSLTSDGAETFPLKPQDEIVGKNLDINAPPGSPASAQNEAARIAAEQAGAGAVPKDKGILGSALDFVNNNKGLTEIVAKGVQGAAEASMGPDQQAYYDAAAKRIGVETDILTTQDEVAKYQAANMQNQVLMITAGDPTAEQQMADAKAKGYKVAIIPAIGTGYQPPSTNMQPAGEPVQAAFPATA